MQSVDSLVKGNGRGGVGLGERRCICGEREREAGLLRRKEAVGGRGGDCAPIHIGGIWLESELFLSLSLRERVA